MNELLLLATATLSVGFIWICWRLGKERLYSAIIIFLILISTVGGKIVHFFGFETNTGNIFYAAVFLATYFLIERYGRREGVRSIWIGTIGVVFFLLLMKITIALSGSGATSSLDHSLKTALDPTSRIAFASLVAYILSQNLNVYLYILLKEKMRSKRLWLRANIANALAQILDSVVFFIIAFWGVVEPPNIVEIILLSLFIKIAFMMLASPLLYFNTVEYEESKSYSAITVH